MMHSAACCSVTPRLRVPPCPCAPYGCPSVLFCRPETDHPVVEGLRKSRCTGALSTVESRNGAVAARLEPPRFRSPASVGREAQAEEHRSDDAGQAYVFAAGKSEATESDLRAGFLAQV